MSKEDIYDPQAYPRHTQQELQYGDMDWQGHINNIAYLRMIESIRAYELFGPEPIGDDSVIYAVARIEADYLRELSWPGVIDIYTRIGRIGNSSFVMEHIIMQDDECCFHGLAVVVTVDKKSRKAVPLTEEMRRTLKRWQSPKEK